jgi:hypothetical protein
MRHNIKGSNSSLIWDTIPGGKEENHEKLSAVGVMIEI